MDDLTADGEPRLGALQLGGQGVTNPAESLEDRLGLSGGDPGSRVPALSWLLGKAILLGDCKGAPELHAGRGPLSAGSPTPVRRSPYRAIFSEKFFGSMSACLAAAVSFPPWASSSPAT